jgi:hypothetical protein
MAWSHKIDIMTSLLLETDHNSSKLAAVYVDAFTMMTDRVILAENTAQVAETEENSSGSTRADKRIFLAKMGIVAGYPRF